MVMSLNQIMKINRKINIFFLLKKMQIIVVNSLKSLKNLYLCLYRRSTTSNPPAHCPCCCSHDRAWRPLSSPAAGLAAGGTAVTMSRVDTVQISNLWSLPGRGRIRYKACIPSRYTWCWSAPPAPGGWRCSGWGPPAHPPPSPTDDIV